MSIIPDIVSEYRVNPFTGDTLQQNIPSEVHVIRTIDELGIAGIRLLEAPYRNPGDPQSSWISINAWDGGAYTIPFNVVDFNQPVNASEFKVAWDPLGNGPRGIIQCNNGDIGTEVEVNYWGLGSVTRSDIYSGIMIGNVIFHFIGTGGLTVAEMRSRGFAICDGTTAVSQGISNPKWTGPTPLMFEEVSPGVWEYRYVASGPEGLVGTIQQWAIPIHGHDDDGHTHSLTDPGHGHGVTDPGHFHDTYDVNGAGVNPGVASNPGNSNNPNAPTSTETTGISIASSTTGLSIATGNADVADPKTIAGGPDLTGRLIDTNRPDTIFAIPMMKVK